MWVFNINTQDTMQVNKSHFLIVDHRIVPLQMSQC